MRSSLHITATLTEQTYYLLKENARASKFEKAIEFKQIFLAQPKFGKHLNFGGLIILCSKRERLDIQLENRKKYRDNMLDVVHTRIY